MNELLHAFNFWFVSNNKNQFPKFAPEPERRTERS